MLRERENDKIIKTNFDEIVNEHNLCGGVCALSIGLGYVQTRFKRRLLVIVNEALLKTTSKEGVLFILDFEEQLLERTFIR